MTTNTYTIPASSDGLKLSILTVTPDQAPKAVVQLTHGMAEHIDRYQEFALFLARNGFLVYGHDQAGHGKSIPSEGIPGFFRDQKNC